MRKRTLLCLSAWIALVWCVPSATTQPGDFVAQTLHESLGKTIDRQENITYFIFGDIPGLTAAKVYRLGSKRYRIHLLRNAEENAQILFLDLSANQFSQLRSGLVNRIDRSIEKEGTFDQPLYAVKESKWRESYQNKRVVLRDGSQIVATLKQAVHDTVIIETGGGLQVAVPDNQISEIISLAGDRYEGKFYRSDPNSSRLLFSPTGRHLKAGNGYFADYYVFFPTLAWGLTDYFSMTGGVSLLPGAESQIVYLAPKLTFSVSPTLGVGVGFLSLMIPTETNHFSLGYAVATMGSDRSGMTLGAGFPLFAEPQQTNFLLLVGGEVQISNSAKLITENWIVGGEDEAYVVSGGIRFFGDRLAVDLALITVKDAFEEGGFPFLPWVDFSVFFGK
ncbi:hypothetical protein JW992_07700 [candidate division KSB1 bacterium]|nr:hypothetical protein [candidate division KSB1 bacterium]